MRLIGRPEAGEARIDSFERLGGRALSPHNMQAESCGAWVTPMKKPKDQLTQAEHFKQAARELGCDESEERFDAALKVIAKHKLKDEAGLKSGALAVSGASPFGAGTISNHFAV
jgi:hypothetical protein